MWNENSTVFHQQEDAAPDMQTVSMEPSAPIITSSTSILSPTQKYYTRSLVRELQRKTLRNASLEKRHVATAGSPPNEVMDEEVLMEAEDISLNGEDEASGHRDPAFHVRVPLKAMNISAARRATSYFPLSAILHPIAVIGFFLHAFRLILAKITAVPLVLIAYMTRLYLSLSISLFRHSVFLFRRVLYYIFFWWWWKVLELGYLFATRWISFVWGLVWKNHLWYHLGFLRPQVAPQQNGAPVTSPAAPAAHLSPTLSQASNHSKSRTHRPRRSSTTKRSLPRTRSNTSIGAISQDSLSSSTTPSKTQRATKRSARSSAQPAKPTTPDKSKAIRDLFHVVPSDRQYKYVVHIPEGRFIPHDRNYRILMKEHQKFSIVLCNDDDTPCCCVILVDGKHVGNVRMEPHSFGSLNRSAYTRRRFVFESKTQQLRRIHSMESMSSSMNDLQAAGNLPPARSMSPQAGRHSRNLSQDEPLTPPPRVPQKSNFDVEVIFCPIDRSFWVRYRKLMLGYFIIALLLYRFKVYVPLGLLCTYYILIPAMFILTYKFFYKDHQILVRQVLDTWKSFNHNLRVLLLGESDGPDLKQLDVQQYIGDEDLHFDSNDAVRVKLSLIPVMTHQFMTQNVIQRHKEEHSRLHQQREKLRQLQRDLRKSGHNAEGDTGEEDARGSAMVPAHRKKITSDIAPRRSETPPRSRKEPQSTPTSSLVDVAPSPIRSMMRRTPSQLRRSITRFISSPLLTMKRKQPLSLECWRHVLSFLDTNSVEFFKLRFVCFELQKLIDEKVFQEIEKMCE